MPSDLKAAFRSPFHRSNPHSQLYDLSSYTRSWETGSLRNEVFDQALPRYSPNRQIPQQLQSKLASNETRDPPSLPVEPDTERPERHQRPERSGQEKLPDDECESLVTRVLANPKCLRVIRSLLNNSESPQIEGFGYQFPEFNRMVLVYILIGIVFLAVLDMFVRIGQMLVK